MEIDGIAMEIDGIDFSSKLENLMEDKEDLNQLNQYLVKVYSNYGNSFEKYSTSFIASVALIISRIAEKLLISFSDTNFEVEVDDSDPNDVNFNIPRESKLAIARLLQESLYKYFIKYYQSFDSSSEPASFIYQLVLKYFTKIEESAKLIAAVSDYILIESLESGRLFLDSRSIVPNFPTQIAIDDVKLIVASTVRNQDIEQSSSFNIDDIVERYGQFSWFYLWNDVELVELWKRLDIDPIVEITLPFDENSIPQEEQEQHLLKMKSMIRKLFFEHGTGGISANLRYMTTSSLPSLADLREFCLVYAPVDPSGKTEDDDGDIDYETEELLKAIREAKDFKTVLVDLNSRAIEGASFLQVYGALTFQVRTNNIGKIECTSYDSLGDFSIMEFLLDSFPDHFDASKVVWPHDDIKIFGTTFDSFIYEKDETIFRAVWAGKTALFANLPGLKESVDSNIHSDYNGLDDEDRLGELRPLHIAAYKSSNSCITTLTDVLKCDINSVAFDGSNALFWGMANGCRLDTLELLISRGCNVNKQILKGPGWQSNMTSFAGFSPLMFAVNIRNIDYVRLLLKSGANTELVTGLLAMIFPLQPSSLLAVHEYRKNGFRFNALHIASITNCPLIISELLQFKAIADGRTRSHRDAGIVEEARYVSDTKHPVDGHFVKELIHLLKTPLHLLSSESLAAKHLVKSGASLLAQDFQLQAAGCCHPDVVKEWFASGSRSVDIRTTLVVCAKHNLSIVCAHRVVEYLVSLHLLDHAERSLRQEMSPAFWPWMALSLTHQQLQSDKNDETLATSWTIHKDSIFDALRECSDSNQVHTDNSVNDEKYKSVIAFTRDHLRASKFKKGRELLDIIKPSILTLTYPIAEETGNGTNQARLL